MKNRTFEPWLEKLPDLSDKVVVVTGTTSGTGYWFSIGALRKKVKVLVVLNRQSSKVEASLADFQKENIGESEIISIACDLQDFKTVKEAAAKVNEVAKEFGGVNVVANNAGLGGQKDERTVDGFDVSMQTNHLSHCLLLKLLMPSLLLAMENGKEVRVCQHSALLRVWDYGPLQENNFRKTEAGTLGGNAILKGWRRYYQTKVANATFAMEFHHQLVKKGLDTKKFKSVCCDPGVAPTGFANNMFKSYGALGKFLHWLQESVLLNLMTVHSAPDASVPLLFTCFGDNVSSGDYWCPKFGGKGEPIRSVHEGALDAGKAKDEQNVLSEEEQANCWKWSEDAVGSIFPDNL